MSNPLEVDPKTLIASSGNFIRIAEVARDIGDGLREELAGLGDFAGNDPFGRAFHDDVDPSVNGLVNTLTNLGTGMDGTADGLKNSAAGYQAVDQHNADSIHPIHP
jgi:hypothetical protein